MAMQPLKNALVRHILETALGNDQHLVEIMIVANGRETSDYFWKVWGDGSSFDPNRTNLSFCCLQLGCTVHHRSSEWFYDFSPQIGYLQPSTLRTGIAEPCIQNTDVFGRNSLISRSSVASSSNWTRSF
jgi:hypothetical protein